MIVTNQNKNCKERKIISVSKKRQITIPLKFYQMLQIGSQVECFIEGNSLSIAPLKSDDNGFSTEILKDLVSQGYSGDELIREFEAQKKNIDRAICNMCEEADEIADGKKHGSTIEDVFGSEDKNV